LADNLNTPQALAVLFDYLTSIEKLQSQKKLIPSQAEEAYQLLLDFDQVLGLEIQEKASREIKVPPMVQQLIEKREEKRMAGKWLEADQLRERIQSLGYQLEDTSQGPRIFPLDFSS